jgi:putative membrane protein
MSLLANVFVGVIALLHIYILVMEMFLWTKPRTLKVFGMTKADAIVSKTLAANMGLYNGFLASGLIYGLFFDNPEFKMFFLVCIAIAGIYGAVTASKRIIYVQTVPAVITILISLFV